MACIITSLNRGGQEIVRELERAYRESERKRERRLGAVDKKYEAIREGNLNAAFKPRGKSKSAKSFPFWVELNPKANDGRGVFEFNEHYPLIARIWELARTMGGARIAEVLMEEGYTSPHPRKGKKKALSDEVVRNILRRRSAVGEFQPTTKGNKPNGDPIPGVFPQVITEAEWKEIRGIIEERDTGLGHSKTKKKANLFEKRSFCANCGGLQGVAPTTAKRLADGSIKEQPGKFRCRVGHKTRGRDCNVNGKQIGVIYDEDALLELLHDFQWEDRYSSTAHGEEINQARQHLLALEGTRGEKQRTLDNIKQGIKAALRAGQAPDPTFIEIQKEADAELIDAENAVAIAENRLNALQSKTVGEAAAREARARVKTFMSTGRDNFDEREDFNAWFHSTGLVLLVDPRTKRFEIGPGKIEESRLVEFWETEWILDSLTRKDRQRYLADTKKLTNWPIEMAAAKKEEEERKRNRVPMTPEQEAELKAWVAKTQKEIAERDRLRQQQPKRCIFRTALSVAIACQIIVLVWNGVFASPVLSSNSSIALTALTANSILLSFNISMDLVALLRIFLGTD